jgi:hypothetical protein
MRRQYGLDEIVEYGSRDHEEDLSHMTTTLGQEKQPADVFVVFGLTGDLAKVMTFPSLYRLEARGLLKCPIVGVAVDDWDVDQLVQRARESIQGTGGAAGSRSLQPIRGAPVICQWRFHRRHHASAGG